MGHEAAIVKASVIFIISSGPAAGGHLQMSSPFTKVPAIKLIRTIAREQQWNQRSVKYILDMTQDTNENTVMF